MVLKPGMEELDNVWVWGNKLSNLLLRQVRTISAWSSAAHASTSIRKGVAERTYFGSLGLLTL